VQCSNLSAAALQVTGPLSSTTDYEEPEPPLPPANASPEDTLELDAKACAATSLSVAGFKVLGIKGRVKGHGEITFTVTFTPTVAGEQFQLCSAWWEEYAWQRDYYVLRQ
jgi:hypothetical protein